GWRMAGVLRLRDTPLPSLGSRLRAAPERQHAATDHGVPAGRSGNEGHPVRRSPPTRPKLTDVHAAGKEAPVEAHGMGTRGEERSIRQRRDTATSYVVDPQGDLHRAREREAQFHVTVEWIRAAGQLERGVPPESGIRDTDRGVVHGGESGAWRAADVEEA